MQPLKYLFACRFRDGLTVVQTPEDVSLSDPTRSAYFDVQSRLDHLDTLDPLSQEFFNRSPLSFSLRDRADDPVAVVHFDSGSFVIHNHPIQVGMEQRALNCFRRPVYFRRNTVQFATHDLANTQHDIRYFIGWEIPGLPGLPMEAKAEKMVISLE